MINVTYSSFSKILNKWFINTKDVRTMEDFKLFALSMNLNYKIITILRT